jgi:hypothetical protein
MEQYFFKKGDKVKVFDYGNEIFDEIVTIIVNDSYTNEIIYERQNGECVVFSNQGYFE